MTYEIEGWRPDALEVIALVGDLPPGWHIWRVETLRSGPGGVKAKVCVAPTEGEPSLELQLIAHPRMGAEAATWRSPYIGGREHPKFLDALATLAESYRANVERESEHLARRHATFARLFAQITMTSPK